MKLCFATNNRHKLEEVSETINDRHKILSLQELSVVEELPETTNTFEGNSLQKALFVFNKVQIPTFADDSGLEVSALNGEPGVFSALYAGTHRSDEANIDLLLKNLSGKTSRKARFRTVFALVGLGQPQFFEGTVEGEIMHGRMGSNGFGYDPVFRPMNQTKTFAEMSLEEKNMLSHRSIAVRKLMEYLKKLANG